MIVVVILKFIAFLRVEHYNHVDCMGVQPELLVISYVAAKHHQHDKRSTQKSVRVLIILTQICIAVNSIEILTEDYYILVVSLIGLVLGSNTIYQLSLVEALQGNLDPFVLDEIK